MDDNSVPTIGLDLNPDMITTQTGVPGLAPKTAPLQSSGIIDITPGAADPSPSSTPPQHIDEPSILEHKIIDITPDGPIDPLLPSPEEEHLDSASEQIKAETYSPQPHLSDILPQSQSFTLPELPDASKPISEIIQEVTPVKTTSTHAEADPITDTSEAATPENTTLATLNTGIAQEIAPVISDPISEPPASADLTPEIPIPVTATPAAEMPTVELPVLDVSQPISSPETATQEFAAPITPSTESPATPVVIDASVNPLFEDPDMVKLKS